MAFHQAERSRGPTQRMPRCPGTREPVTYASHPSTRDSTSQTPVITTVWARGCTRPDACAFQKSQCSANWSWSNTRGTTLLTPIRTMYRNRLAFSSFRCVLNASSVSPTSTCERRSKVSEAALLAARMVLQRQCLTLHFYLKPKDPKPKRPRTTNLKNTDQETPCSAFDPVRKGRSPKFTITDH